MKPVLIRCLLALMLVTISSAMREANKRGRELRGFVIPLGPLDPTSQPSSVPSSPTISPTTAAPSHSFPPSSQPSSFPSTSPSAKPSAQPINVPSSSPTSQPFSSPSTAPSSQPFSSPSTAPSSQPFSFPSTSPSSQPSSFPSTSPSAKPSAKPINAPSSSPTSQPFSFPSSSPSGRPSVTPTTLPSSLPSSQPSSIPSTSPSARPSAEPTSQPSFSPFSRPSSFPSIAPSAAPTAQPTLLPSSFPSVGPTILPSSQPTSVPSAASNSQPTAVPDAVIAGSVLGAVAAVAVIGTLVWLYYTGQVACCGFVICALSKNNPDEGKLIKNEQIGGGAANPLYIEQDKPFSSPYVPPPSEANNMKAFRKEDFNAVNKVYYGRLNLATLQTNDLAHLNKGGLGATVLTIQGKFPTRDRIKNEIDALPYNPDFQEWFKSELPNEEVYLRSAAIVCIVRLVDSAARSTVLFSKNVQDLSALFQHPCSEFSQPIKEKVRNYIDNNWEEIFRDLLDNPSSLLSARSTSEQVQHILFQYEIQLDSKNVLNYITQYFAQFDRSATRKLVKVALLVALSPSILFFDVQTFVSAYQSSLFKTVGESGSGKTKKAVLAIPATKLKGDGSNDVVLSSAHAYVLYS